MILGIVASIGLKSDRFFASSENGDVSGQAESNPLLQENDPRLPPPTKRERNGGADAQALRELEIEFDRILPAQYPEQPSSLSDAILQPGEALVLGGFRRTDGNYGFTILQVEALKADGTPFIPGETDAAPLQYRVISKALAMSQEASSEAGLGALISPAKTRIQKNLSFPSAEVTQILGGNTAGAATMPTVVARAGSSASINIGTEKQGYVISVMITPDEGSDSVRLRTRVENPDGQ
ncbi:hypothetical protein HZ994_16555 [Akkermansiaceae bacterium]|nr:hypothetical protein HZ994_16555 [Akkermansiaceae bacterium]